MTRPNTAQLQIISDARDYGRVYPRGHQRRTAQAMARRGWLQDLGGHQFTVTTEGLKAAGLKPQPDRWADTAASSDVRWMEPADFDVADDSELADDSRGWFHRDTHPMGGAMWSGPFVTSAEAAAALAKIA